MRLSKKEKEDILFQFWVKTSSEKFPFTMNLVLTSYPFTTCSVTGFVLLFSEGMKIHKPGVKWVTLQSRCIGMVNVQLSWLDPPSKSEHRVLGTGELLIEETA